MKAKLIFLLLVVSILVSGCGSQVTGTDVVTAFKDAGLEAENPTAVTKDEYGLAPYVCDGTHFFVPSLGEDAGGRVFICDNKEDQDALFNYYDKLGKTSAMFFSWVFVKGDVLVQINGELPETIARQYEAAIP